MAQIYKERRLIMKKQLLCVLVAGLLFSPIRIQAEETIEQGYTTMIEGKDWGPAITKLVIPTIKSNEQFKVTAHKTAIASTGEEINEDGSVDVLSVYRCNEEGEKDSQGDHTALELSIHPDASLTNPFYFDIEAFSNSWADISFVIENDQGDTWTKELTRKKLVADEFKKGNHTYTDEEFGDITLQYAEYAPKQDNKKNPLIIWLHGMGEGGTDPDIVLLGNKVTNLAKDPIQSYYDGAYVFAPQSPTFWLDNGTGTMSEDGNSMYTRALMDTIDAYVKDNDDIDPERIYIGGCSNGGFMTMRMLMSYPEYFAAAYPICDAMYDAFITDTDIQRIKHIPIWFTHASSDALAMVADTSIPTYERLIEAGASDTHFTLYDAVIDKTGMYQDQEGAPYMYNAHYSWIYTLNNDPKLDFEGEPVMINDKPVTIFEWMAQQKKQPMSYVEPGFIEQYGVLIGAMVLVLLVVGATTIGKKKEEHSYENI